MGDYNKLIVACTVKKEIKEELKIKIKELSLYTSAYQSDEIIEHVEEAEEDLKLILVGQTKWGERQEEFCDWLKPHVTQGSGENDVYAMSFSEYSDQPRMWRLSEESK